MQQNTILFYRRTDSLQSSDYPRQTQLTTTTQSLGRNTSQLKCSTSSPVHRQKPSPIIHLHCGFFICINFFIWSVSFIYNIISFYLQWCLFYLQLLLLCILFLQRWWIVATVNQKNAINDQRTEY